MQKKRFRQIFSKNPEDEGWFKEHEWVRKSIYEEDSDNKIINLKCMLCDMEIICVGYVENGDSTKEYLIDVQEVKHPCSELMIKGLIE